MIAIQVLKKLVFAISPLLIMTMAISISYGQETPCDRMYREALEYSNGGNYRLALHKLNAAKICNPQEKKYDKLIITIYDSINLQKTIATNARQVAEIALKNEKTARRLSEKRLASYLYKSAVYDFADKGNFLESYILLSQAAAKDPTDTSIRNMISQIMPLLSDTVIPNVSFTKKINWRNDSYQLLVQKIPNKTSFDVRQWLRSSVRV